MSFHAQIARRGFLSGLAAASVGVTASSFAPWSATAFCRGADASKPGLKLGLQLYSLRGFSVDEALRHAKELGFEQVEFYSGMLPLDSSVEEIASMRKKVAELGLSISAHGVNAFGADAEKNRQTFEFAKALGIPTITADPSPEAFDSLDDLVKEFDIRIAIHNHGPRHRYNQVIDVLRAIEGRDERIGACADLGHFIRSGQKPVEVIRLLKGRLYGIHLKDFAEMKDRTEGVILGKGHMDVRAVFAALMDVGFPANGALSLEYEENPKDPIADIKECVAISQKAMADLQRDA